MEPSIKKAKGGHRSKPDAANSKTRKHPKKEKKLSSPANSPDDSEQAVLLEKMPAAENNQGEIGDNHESPERAERGRESEDNVMASSENMSSVETLTLNGSSEDLDNSCLGKTKRILRTIYKGARSLLGLIILLVAYAFLGALIFMLIESRHETKYKSNITNIREDMIGELLKKINSVSDVEQWKLDTKTMLIEYEESIRVAVKNNVATNSTVQVWTMWSGMFFVFTVFTTIGYGNITPVTDLGRVVCIIYAAIGIPLALLLLAELGKRFTVVLKFLWAFVRRYYYHGYCRKIRSKNPLKKKYHLNGERSESEVKDSEGEVRQSEDEEKHPRESARHSVDDKHSEDDINTDDEKSEVDRSRSGSRVVYGYEIDDEFNVPITVALVILLVYVMLGAMMYSIWESWGFIEAFYFVFISIATIGFGDVLPAHQNFFVVSSVYVCIGLSLVSMCINVAIEYFNTVAIRAKKKMGAAKKKIGDTAKKAGRNAKEKVANIKTNIADETHRIKQKTDQRITNIKTNIVDETSKLRQKTDEKISGIKSNISEETHKLRKMADEKFRKPKRKESKQTEPPNEMQINTESKQKEVMLADKDEDKL